jgi:ribonuclease E
MEPDQDLLERYRRQREAAAALCTTVAVHVPVPTTPAHSAAVLSSAAVSPSEIDTLHLSLANQAAEIATLTARFQQAELAFEERLALLEVRLSSAPSLISRTPASIPGPVADSEAAAEPESDAVPVTAEPVAVEPVAVEPVAVEMEKAPERPAPSIRIIRAKTPAPSSEQLLSSLERLRSGLQELRARSAANS